MEMTTADETRTIEPDDAEDVMYRDDRSAVGPWIKEAEQHISEHRWYDRFWLVLRHEDGTYWGLEYEVGKTEIQETEWPWREEPKKPLKLTQLFPHPVHSIEFKPRPAPIIANEEANK